METSLLTKHQVGSDRSIALSILELQETVWYLISILFMLSLLFLTAKCGYHAFDQFLPVSVI